MPKRLTERGVAALEPPEKGQLIVYDSELRGFGVRVTANGRKAFILNYRFDDPDDQRRRSSEYRFTIGTFGPHEWTVAAARKEATSWRRQIDRGIGHPMQERRRRRDAVEGARAGDTFKASVEDYIKRVQEGQRGNATAGEVKRAILKCCEEWHDWPVATITARDVRGLLEAILSGDDDIVPRPYMANRLFAYLRPFFSWCAEPGIERVERSPMDGLRRPWDGEESRDRVYSDEEIEALWKAADAIGGAGGAFLKVLILTGKRKRALAAMRWEELDDNGVWTPPVDARRRKRVKRVHVTPLPKLAVRVVRGMKKVEDNPFVFVGRLRGTHLDPGSPLQRDVQDKSGVGDFFWHACRHTVETRLAELGVAPHVRDLVLDHAPARGAGAGYDHHHYGSEMRAALEVWAAHVEAMVAPSGAAVLR